jgi:hypothetical protein
MIRILILVAFLLLQGAGMMLLIVLIQEIYKQPKKRTRKQQRREMLDSPARRKVIRLLNGDFATAERLFDQARSAHSGNSEEWLWDKVAWDILRDRRC